MKSRPVFTAVAATAAALAAAAGNRGASDRAAERQSTEVVRADQDKSEPALSTKEIMGKAHKGKQSLFFLVQQDIRKANPDWQADEKSVAEMIRLVSMLTKNNPPKGSKEGWDKLVQEYVDKAKAVQQNLKEEKLRESRTAFNKLMATCKSCHETHNPH
jgi:soluble cytochrome b562